MRILCGRCNRIIQVAGRLWEFRLSHSDKDTKGNYTGWHCDSCTDAVEHGSDY